MFLTKLFAGALLAGSTSLSIAVAAAPAPASSPAGAEANAAQPEDTTPGASAARAPDDAASRAADDTFLQLREAARKDDAARAAELAARLGDYPLASYVEYYQLKPRLRQAAPEQVLDFLRRHEGSAVAERLRTDWLYELGRQGDWAGFERELARLKGNPEFQLRCYRLLARGARGEKVGAEARDLLLNPRAYGEPCGKLITYLGQSGQFGRDDLLTQLRLAGEANATGPARRVAELLGASGERAAKAVDMPALALARGIGKSRVEREIYLVALGRMARSSQKLALASLKRNERKLGAQERAIAWANIALPASIRLEPEAAAYWKKSQGAPLSREQLQWKTRIALREGDWEQVRETIEAMPESLAEDSTWVYWRARALEEQGRKTRAKALYESIAGQGTFYAQLALEELGRKITVPRAPAALKPAELDKVASDPDLQRAFTFYRLGLRLEGNREWGWALRGFSERELLAAGELARRADLIDRMVDASARSRTEYDYAQRFPAPHYDLMRPAAQELGLDKAWVYGLIRQESRFITDARSVVGASGLMQVMPATGSWVAKKIGLTDYVHEKLNDLHTNILLGTNYMNMVLANVDGSQVLATAAYNAGPGRARTWRRALSEPMEGAVFVETIPFSETRGYVRNVMANATNYAALFEKTPQSLKERLGTITPRGEVGG